MISYVKYDIYSLQRRISFRRSPVIQSRMERMSPHDTDRQMDFDEERDFADQGSLTDIDMEEDSQILATLLKHLPSCINAADMEHLLVLHF